MTASLTLFQLDGLPVLGRLEARRLFDGREFPYELECSAWPEFWSMEVRDATALGWVASRIDFLFRLAAQRQETVKVGPVFSRKMNGTKELIVELGITNNTTIYLQMFTLPRATLRGEQIGVLLAALRRLDEDAGGIRGAGNAMGLAQ
jgi:hypothetical protein